MASVMAHELSHVALRHGTAQASKATKYEIGAAGGRGARRDHRRKPWRGRLAGHAVRHRHRVPALRPRVRAAGRHSGRPDHGAGRLRPPRDGQHVQDDRERGRVRRAGVAEESPEPANRQTAILKEAASLRVENPIRDSREFEQVKAALSACPRRRPPRKRRAAGASGQEDRWAPAADRRVERLSTRYTDRRGSVPGQRAVELAGGRGRPATRSRSRPRVRTERSTVRVISRTAWRLVLVSNDAQDSGPRPMTSSTRCGKAIRT